MESKVSNWLNVSPERRLTEISQRVLNAKLLFAVPVPMGERTCACGDKKSGARTIETRNETLVFPNHFRLPSRARPTPASSPRLLIHPLYQYLHLKRISIASLMLFCRLWTSRPCSKSSTTRAKLDAQFSGPEIPRFRADFAGTFLFVFLNHSLS